MVFGAIMPAFVGLANWHDADDGRRARHGAAADEQLAFWILPLAFTMLLSTLFMDGGAPNFGWTFYAPLSTTYAPAQSPSSSSRST